MAKGDTVDVVAYGLYQQPARANFGFTLTGFVTGLLQPAVAGPAPPDGGRRVRILPLLSVGLGLVPAVEQLAGGVPKAYVRVLVYNADSVLVDRRIQQLSLAAQGNYERLCLRVLVPGAGYVQAYVANESDTDVFFDDISVEHRQGLQVQENQYDPYGLDLAGLSRSATEQVYLERQGAAERVWPQLARPRLALLRPHAGPLECCGSSSKKPRRFSSGS